MSWYLILRIKFSLLFSDIKNMFSKNNNVGIHEEDRHRYGDDD
jgi:hypothetical protein